jgi:hypothetical protein
MRSSTRLSSRLSSRLAIGVVGGLALAVLAGCATPITTAPTTADATSPTPTGPAQASPTPTTTSAPPTSTGPTKTPRATKAPSPSKPRTTGGIPTAAFVTAPSNPAGVKPKEGGFFLPQTFCGLAPTHETVIARRTRTIQYYRPGASSPDASIHQTISTYRPGGAEKFMLQMRTVTDGCTGDFEGGNTLDYRQLPWQPDQSDDHLLVERGTDPTGSPARTISYLVVMRLGDVVTVLNVYGRDGQHADRSVAELFADRAAAAIVAWRR